jgi:hypothetical protein
MQHHVYAIDLIEIYADRRNWEATGKQKVVARGGKLGA